MAQRIEQMQALWQQKVQPGTKLVRWLLKPDDNRMYEGFCRLEASPHGSLNEFFVLFYTVFNDPYSYSKEIISNWVQEMEADPAQLAALSGAGIAIKQWNFKEFAERAGTENPNAVLLDMLNSYRKLIPDQQVPLVLSILPKGMSTISGFQQWLLQLMQLKWPPQLRLLVFDHEGSNFWGDIFEQEPEHAVTLNMDLKMDEAIRQIATSGNPGSPEVIFRKCLYEMGDAARKGQVSQIHHWGTKAIEAGQRSGMRNLLATAYISYAGMLFNFKDFAAVDRLLDDGIRVCKTGIAAGDESMKPLLLQFYGYKAAALQHQKETRKAFEWFMTQGQEAKNWGMYPQSVSGYHKAWVLADYKKYKKEGAESLQQIIHCTPHLSDDDIKASEYPYMAYQYLLQYDKKQEVLPEAALVVESRMENVYGADWRAMVKEWKLNQQKKHVQGIQAAGV